MSNLCTQSAFCLIVALTEYIVYFCYLDVVSNRQPFRMDLSWINQTGSIIYSIGEVQTSICFLRLLGTSSRYVISIFDPNIEPDNVTDCKMRIIFGVSIHIWLVTWWRVACSQKWQYYHIIRNLNFVYDFVHGHSFFLINNKVRWLFIY